MDEKEYVLEKPIPPAPPANAPKVVKDANEKQVKDENQVSWNPVGPDVLKMIGYITNMEKLGFTLQKELATDLILQSLSKLYKGFVMNYMVHDLDKPLLELLKMLQPAEENLTKGKDASVLMVQVGKEKPKKGIKIKVGTIGKPKSKSTSFATQKPVGGLQRANVIIVVRQATGGETARHTSQPRRRKVRPFLLRRYSFYHHIDKKVLVARNGVFLEKEFFSDATSGRNIELEEIRDDKETTAPVQEHELEEQTIIPQNAQDTQEPRRSNRLRTQHERYGLILTFEGDVILIDQDESKTYLEAISCPEAEEWRQTMQFHVPKPKEVERMRNAPYASAIRSIMYAMVCMRPDVAFALSVTSRYQSNPGESHWMSMKNILKYFRRTKDALLVYGGKEELSIVGIIGIKSTFRNIWKIS
ncbi:unnamed protein product [Cuscuta campestris]|uniref:Reverse transcriptase Ty1/copia-type domain-containing protein n=1 Tax=Cuscuta campestris TaxID=132261 RepID=A0A484K7J1_9ASTE|nr:unnamed protein product [Cuscuta campestris]